jgi:hypothetical protein
METLAGTPHMTVLKALLCCVVNLSMAVENMNRQLASEWVTSELMPALVTFSLEQRQVLWPENTGTADVWCDCCENLLYTFAEWSSDESLAGLLLDQGVTEIILLPLLRAALAHPRMLTIRDHRAQDRTGLAYTALSAVCIQAMWTSSKPALLKMGLVDVIQRIAAATPSPSETDDRHKATIAMILAYLIGSKERKDNPLLATHAASFDDIFLALKAALRGEDFRGLHSQPWELLLALHNLALSDTNKPLLGTQSYLAIWLSVLKTYKRRSVREVELASQTLLELTFLEENRRALRSPPLRARKIINHIYSKMRSPERAATHRALGQLLYLLQQGPASIAASSAATRAPPPLKPNGHVMLSYAWAYQVCTHVYLYV